VVLRSDGCREAGVAGSTGERASHGGAEVVSEAWARWAEFASCGALASGSLGWGEVGDGPCGWRSPFVSVLRCGLVWVGGESGDRPCGWRSPFVSSFRCGLVWVFGGEVGVAVCESQLQESCDLRLREEGCATASARGVGIGHGGASFVVASLRGVVLPSLRGVVNSGVGCRYGRPGHFEDIVLNCVCLGSQGAPGT